MYFLAEEFAFRELEREFSSRIARGMILGEGSRVEVDGLMAVMKRHALYAIEVKMVRPADHERAVAAGLSHLDRIGKEYPVKPLLALVLAPGVKDEVRELLQTETAQTLKARNPAVTLRVYDFEEMEKRYGLAAPPASS
jgi:hypothetical protein